MAGVVSVGMQFEGAEVGLMLLELLEVLPVRELRAAPSVGAPRTCGRK